MIGRITDGFGLDYCIPLDVYVQHHYNKMLYKQLENYMEALVCERFEDYADYLTKEIDNLQNLRKKARNEQMKAIKELQTLKHDANWKSEHIDRVIERIKQSNKMPVKEFQDFHLSMIQPIDRLRWNTEAKAAEISDELNMKLKADVDKKEKKILRMDRRVKERIMV